MAFKINGTDVTAFANHVRTSTKPDDTAWPAEPLDLGRVTLRSLKKKCFMHYPYLSRKISPDRSPPETRGGCTEDTRPAIRLRLKFKDDYAYVFQCSSSRDLSDEPLCSFDYAVRYLGENPSSNNLTLLHVWDPLNHRPYCGWRPSQGAVGSNPAQVSLLRALFPQGRDVDAVGALECITPRRLQLRPPDSADALFAGIACKNPMSMYAYLISKIAEGRLRSPDAKENILNYCCVYYQVKVEKRKQPIRDAMEFRHEGDDTEYKVTRQITEHELFSRNKTLREYVMDRVLSPDTLVTPGTIGGLGGGSDDVTIKKLIANLFAEVKKKALAEKNSMPNHLDHRKDHAITSYAAPVYDISCDTRADALTKLRHIFNAVPCSVQLYDNALDAASDISDAERAKIPRGECIRRFSAAGAFCYSKITSNTPHEPAGSTLVTERTLGNHVDTFYMQWFHWKVLHFGEESKRVCNLHATESKNKGDDYLVPLCGLIATCCSFASLSDYRNYPWVKGGLPPTSVVPREHVPALHRGGSLPSDQHQVHTVTGWTRQPAGYLHAPVPFSVQIAFNVPPSLPDRGSNKNVCVLVRFPRGTPENAVADTDCPEDAAIMAYVRGGLCDNFKQWHAPRYLAPLRDKETKIQTLRVTKTGGLACIPEREKGYEWPSFLRAYLHRAVLDAGKTGSAVGEEDDGRIAVCRALGRAWSEIIQSESMDRESARAAIQKTGRVLLDESASPNDAASGWWKVVGLPECARSAFACVADARAERDAAEAWKNVSDTNDGRRSKADALAREWLSSHLRSRTTTAFDAVNEV